MAWSVGGALLGSRPVTTSSPRPSQDVDRIDVDDEVDSFPSPAAHGRLHGAAHGRALRLSDEELVSEDALDSAPARRGRALNAAAGEAPRHLLSAIRGLYCC